MRRYRLTVPGRFESLAQIADFISQAARDAGFEEDDVFYVQMAVDEACSNIAEHAYGAGCSGDITLTCSLKPGADPGLGPGNTFVVTIHDTGRPFDPYRIPEPLLEANLEDLPEGGLGIYFMRKLMDEVRFEFDPDSGNTLTMTKVVRQRSL